MSVIYMDNAATSYPKPESVYVAVDRFMRHLGGNPGRGSSRHAIESGSVIVEARDALANLFNVQNSDNIAFSMNVTEALNTAIKGVLEPGDHVITTSMEHNAVARPLAALEKRGIIEWTRVPCLNNGSFDPQEVADSIRSNTKMICMLHASNVTGTIMPITEVGKIARERGVLFVVDSAQTAGVLPIDVKAMQIDILTFTGHKSLFGPQGTGGLYVRPGLSLVPLKEGGTGSLSEDLEQPEHMPDRLEAGTQNAPGIAGLLAGIDFIKLEGLDTIRTHEEITTGMLMDGLKDIKGIEIYGPNNAKDRTAVVSFNIQGMDCGETSTRLDYEFNIISRSGLHCAPLAHQTMGTLQRGACRLSPGYFTTEEDVDKVIRAVHQVARETR
ncbi:MAG: aminotransferase class V-fold PLP-dependent enzyme [Candidatus Saccharibacteria bacterium]